MSSCRSGSEQGALSPASAPALAVARLELARLRCFPALALEPCPPSGGVPVAVALTGPNGSGKTSVLEALSLFAPGRSLRGAPVREIALRPELLAHGKARHRSRTEGTPEGAGGGEGVAERAPGVHGGAHGGLDAGGGFSVRLHLADGVSGGGGGAGGAAGLPVRLAELGPSGRLRYELDGQSASAAACAVAMLWLTPAHDLLLSGPASPRRAFFDRIAACFEPDHARILARAVKLRRERRALLEELRQSGQLGDEGWLAGLEAGLADETLAAARNRMRAASALAAALPSLPAPFLRLSLQPLFSPAPLAAAAASPTGLDDPETGAALRRVLAGAREEDAVTGRTAVGPDRFDAALALPLADPAGLAPSGLVVPPGATPAEPPASSHTPALAAPFASTGEEKRAILSLLLAAASALVAAARPPILLLDELAAHLDPQVGSALYDALGGLGVQSWSSGQKAEDFPSSRFHRIGLGGA